MHLHDIAVDSVVSAARARTLGVGPAELRSLVRDGAIRRLVRGWYAVRGPDDDIAPWEDNDPFAAGLALHRLTTTALVRSFEGRVGASHQSALVLHGVHLWRSDLSTVHLARTVDDHTRHRRGAVIHPATGVDPVEVGGLLSVPPAVAVVQVGLRPERGRPAFPLESLVAADSALRQGLADRDTLAAAVALHEGHPGIRAVRTHLEHADGRNESVGETRLGVCLRVLGYETEPQALREVGVTRYRADRRIRGTRVLVEFDGLVKYLPTHAAAEDVARAREVLEAEKVRQDHLLDSGDEMVRVRWRQLDDLQALRRRIDAAIERSQRRSA